MAEDVKPETIKRTQDLLGKYFKKPPLTEKLLRKPPFRFLHDIVSTVINETGFLDGLYTEEELNSENIKNKEAKLAYLTKLIDVVKLATGINLTVRASKIISGQEPTKTNELLQAIGKALDKKINSAEAIEQYKKNLGKGKSSSRSKLSVAKDEKRSSSKETSQKRASTSKEKSTEQKKKVINENPTINEETRKNENQESQKSVEATKAPQTELTQEKIPSSAHRKRSSSAKPKQNTSFTALSEIPLQSDKKTDENKKQKESENRLKNTANAENNEAQNQILNQSSNLINLESVSNAKDNKVDENTDKVGYKENTIINNEIPLKNIEKSDQSISEIQKLQSENNDARPKTSLRPPTARPISARPAAPRIRGKAELIVNEEILTPMGHISVIVENSDLKDDDDAEDMVVMETKGSGSDFLETNDHYKADDQLTQEHGHLVAQILETQKELINNDNVDVIPKKTNITWDTNSKRDMVTKEIDKLRNTIQTLTRATNPLGKLLDYFQEDVEIMQKELLEWKNQYQQVNEQLKVEKMKTQELIEPMKETLKEIDHNMKLQLDKICQAKSQIMKNDQRIQTLLNGRV
ncbi:TRAF3-interacting protein 1 isoform X2 [Frieseomelitta varia]|uniref:TRAF3-interacting protein 1 isoform X2 n=1 Tax=Frieseomelitta varia TaxID=561572 RepID=UPI001CB680D7|nr:TRAF3-interacting protein 1 isoform X2 [Frieseomelitta varia]